MNALRDDKLCAKYLEIWVQLCVQEYALESTDVFTSHLQGLSGNNRVGGGLLWKMIAEVVFRMDLCHKVIPCS